MGTEREPNVTTAKVAVAPAVLMTAATAFLFSGPNNDVKLIRKTSLMISHEESLKQVDRH